MPKLLDAAITNFLNELEALREKNPVETVSQVLEDMFDAQIAAEGKAVNLQSAERQQALAALTHATQAVQAATADPAKTDSAVQQTRAAIEAVLAAS